jgi:hypothetical protein
MAPAHSFDVNTLDALRKLNFKAITDGYGFYPYELRSMLLVPQLVSYPLSISLGYQTICVHINMLSQRRIDEMTEFARKNAAKFIDFKRTVERGQIGGVYAHALRVCSAFYLQFRRRRNRTK